MTRTRLGFLVFCLVNNHSLFATTLRYHYNFTSQWRASQWQGDFWREPEKPMVPVVRIPILLPYGEDLESVHFTSSPEEVSAPAHYVLAPKPRTICGGTSHQSLVPQANLPEIFPENHLAPHSFVTTQNGFRVLHVSLFPSLLSTATGIEKRISGGDLVIETHPSPSTLYRGLSHDREEVAAQFPANQRSSKQNSVWLTYRETRAPASLDYLIIAPQLMIDDTEPDSLNRFLFEKNNKGVRTTTLSVESIETRYPGIDLQAKIRAAITDYYRKGIQYVLLVGNGYSSVPTKKLFVTLPDRTGSLPSDYYYACLDGDLNEANPDLACEVAVGRAPVTTLADLHTFVRKTELMQALEDDDPRLGNELNFGEELDVSTLGSQLIDQLIGGGQAGTLSTQGYPTATATRKFYETHVRQFSSSEALEAINTGQFYTINHVGHADETLCMRIRDHELSQLNNDIPFFAITQGCHPGNISVPNWASKLMNLPNGGAGAIIANSNYGFYHTGSSDGPSNRFQMAFYDSYFRDGLKTLGKLHFQAKKKIAPQIQDDKTMLWVIYETNLLGDPELELKLPRH